VCSDNACLLLPPHDLGLPAGLGPPARALSLCPNHLASTWTPYDLCPAPGGLPARLGPPARALSLCPHHLTSTWTPYDLCPTPGCPAGCPLLAFFCLTVLSHLSSTLTPHSSLSPLASHHSSFPLSSVSPSPSPRALALAAREAITLDFTLPTVSPTLATLHSEL
jgi:hypothetical protein